MATQGTDAARQYPRTGTHHRDPAPRAPQLPASPSADRDAKDQPAATAIGPGGIPETLAERIAWFHTRRSTAELARRVAADEDAWRLYTLWLRATPGAGQVTRQVCLAQVARIPELALTGRRRPGTVRHWTLIADGVASCDEDWATRTGITPDDMTRQGRDGRWRAGYELRWNELAATLPHPPTCPARCRRGLFLATQDQIGDGRYRCPVCGTGHDGSPAPSATHGGAR